MKNNNLILKTLFIVIIFIGYGANVINEESKNYIITLEGERIECYGQVSMDATKVYYKNEEGKGRATKQKESKVMVVYGHIFLNLSISKNMNRLQEVYAYNEEYVLTAYVDGSYIYVYIWDKNFKLVEEKVSFMTGAKAKRNKERFNAQVKKYFVDCEYVIKTISKNIDNNDAFNKGLLHYNCDESVDPLTTYLELF